MRTTTVVVAVAALMLAVAVDVRAQAGGGWEADSTYGKLYDPAKVETISGEVVNVGHITPMPGMGFGVHLVVRTTAGKIVSVHLGPGWFIDNQSRKIQPKDKVEVKGAPAVVETKPSFLAAEVRTGGAMLIVRDGAGRPVWDAWRIGASPAS